MFCETIFEKNGIPNTYVCTHFLVNEENSVTLTYISHDIDKIGYVRMKATQALRCAKFLDE